MDDHNDGEKRWVMCGWRLVFFFSRNEIEFEWWDDIMIGEGEWINEYFIFDFNFEFHHECVWGGILLIK